jgi:hypothetical protein
MLVLVSTTPLLAWVFITVLAGVAVFTPPLVRSELMVWTEAYKTHHEQTTALVLGQVCTKGRLLNLVALE